VQGVSPKATRGEISSINGEADDPRAWQISVPVQPGNSGGALLDSKGAVIGIVVSKLGIKAATKLGDLPQNVSYALKIGYAMPIIDQFPDILTNSVPTAPEPKFEDMIADAEKSTVLLLVR
jgi:S1-C subfamily serine protease